ncbi:substrate-binding domain-containing protein [Metabacillus bambusae]|uniref:Substrate-binding domain-containing protein n=1 Tax=Metabacillus bambusae TaxID=2795218 RepID=A0ABS3N380_9BACI|nr:substrate-binding domain-containing protein [Metabacillus bambusae]MBO1512529.1 substrate-binding domain-containing protein [Metabacillus bambusae]
MKKLLIVYVFLFSIFFIYLYNYHLKEPHTSPFGQIEERLQGEIGEKYVLVTFQAGIDYWKSAIKGFEDAASELNVSVEYRGATQYDSHEQITVLEQVIAKKPAGIALSAINPYELNTTINKAVEAGIPVVLFDSDAPASDAYSFLGTNNYAAGVTGAHKMADLLDHKGKLAVVTLPNQLNHKERTDGFVETIRNEYPDMEVIAIEDGKGDQLRSEQAAAEIIKLNPDIKGVFATEANGGVGIAEATRSLKKEKAIKIISFDTDKQTLDKIKEGVISATLAQGSWNMGYWSLQFLFQHNHETSTQQQSVQSAILPKYVDTGISIVTDENVEDYYAD